jgi:hypothetical protein
MKQGKPMKLLIQNKGVAPTEAYTLMGLSLSRSEDSLIGQFGSGAKLAITTLLRKGLKVTIYCGKTRMEFKTKTIEVADGIESKQQQQVYVQYGGTSKRREDLGWVLGMGEMDWTCDENMAIREFVANAIDHTVKRGDNIRESFQDRDLAVECVEDNFMRAQDGYTRVFIDLTEDGQAYVDELPKRFLHFARWAKLGVQIMPKLSDSRKAQVYYNGVFVRELDGSADSLFDYNFTGTQIKIDESRNLDEYQARAAIGRLWRDAPVDDLVIFFKALCKGTECLECGLDSYYLKPQWGGATEAQKDNWRLAWEKVNGQNAVACQRTDGIVGEFARKKGFDLGIIDNSAMMDVVTEYDIPTVASVLDDNERKGRVLTPPSFEAIDAVTKVWGWITTTDLVDTEKCKKPTVKGFDEATDAGGECLGFYKTGTSDVYIRNDLGGDLLLETALEEVVHYVTGATDNSRDFQNFIMRLFIRWMK